MKFIWSEVNLERSPKTSVSILAIPIEKETDGSTFTNTLAITPYTASLNTTYTIQLEVFLTS